MLYLKSFCCCCSLRTGGVVIGWIGVVLSAFIMTGVSVSIAKGELASRYGGSVVIPHMLVVAILGLFSHLLVLAGSATGKASMLWPYLIIQMINIVIHGLVVFVGCPVLISKGGDFTVTGIVIMVVGFLLLVYILYCWLCVLNLFKELRQIRSHETNQNLNGFLNQDSPPPYTRFA